MRRARPLRAGRSPPHQASRVNSAASGRLLSSFHSHVTAAAPAAPGHFRGIIMSASSRRYLSVWLGLLSTDRIAKRFPPDALVIAAPVKGALRLSAVNDAAVALGLRVGMPLADARAMYPKLAVADADESADFALLEAIADWCDRYTPLVGLDPPDGLTLDISGCAHLFGGEAALAADLVRRLTRQDLQARVAVAGTVGCAWGVARFSPALPPPARGRSIREADRVGVIASGDERDTIAPLPL